VFNLSLTGANEFRRVLCLGAHCDDIEIGCGGTLLTLIEENPKLVVDWVVFASSPIREPEALASANAFLRDAADSTVVIKQFRNGYFPFTGAEIKDFFESLKSLPSPDLILTHQRNDRHQDHRTISDLTWNTFRDHLILEYEIPKYDGDLGQPNVFVPLTEQVWRRKIALTVEHFQSQKERSWFSEDTFRSLMRLRGVECNAPSGHAEAFYGRKLGLTS